MEKILFGKVTLYRLQCPKCDEYNLSGNNKFYCTSCETSYSVKVVDKIRREAKLDKRNFLTKKIQESLLNSQNNKCYYCEHEFGKFYEKDNVIRKLKPYPDLLLPLDLNNERGKDEWILICNVCESFRGKKQFETAVEQKQWLKYMWSKKLDLGKLDIY